MIPFNWNPTACRIRSTITQEKDEAAWKQVRDTGIGGSDIGAICGVSPFSSARQIYLAKTHQYEDALKPSDAAIERMRFGSLLEPIVADEYARITGAVLAPINATLVRCDTPWALANVDRLMTHKDMDGIGILECKTTGEYNLDEWDSGEILLSYIYQLNWYFWVTGLKWGAFACLVGGNKFFHYTVFRDDDLINNVLIPKATEFWNEYVSKMQEPPLASVDTDFANTIYADVVKGSEIALPDDDANILAKTVVECKASIKELEATLEEAKNKLKDLLKNTEIGYTQDYVVKWSPRQRRSVSAEILKKNYPDIYNQCTKVSSFRVMTVKGGVADVSGLNL